MGCQNLWRGEKTASFAWSWCQGHLKAAVRLTENSCCLREHWAHGAPVTEPASWMSRLPMAAGFPESIRLDALWETHRGGREKVQKREGNDEDVRSPSRYVGRVVTFAQWAHPEKTPLKAPAFRGRQVLGCTFFGERANTEQSNSVAARAPTVTLSGNTPGSGGSQALLGSAPDSCEDSTVNTRLPSTFTQ